MRAGSTRLAVVPAALGYGVSRSVVLGALCAACIRVLSVCECGTMKQPAALQTRLPRSPLLPPTHAHAPGPARAAQGHRGADPARLRPLLRGGAAALPVDAAGAGLLLRGEVQRARRGVHPRGYAAAAGDDDEQGGAGGVRRRRRGWVVSACFLNFVLSCPGQACTLVSLDCNIPTCLALGLPRRLAHCTAQGRSIPAHGQYARAVTRQLRIKAAVVLGVSCRFPGLSADLSILS
jgi:hypothetical protein